MPPKITTTKTVRTEATHEIRIPRSALVAALQEAGLLPVPLPPDVKLTVEVVFGASVAEVRAMAPLEVTWSEERTWSEESE